MSRQAFNIFKEKADILLKETGIKYDAKPYKETIRKMLDGYCAAYDAGDEYLKDLYISGLMLRHWDKVKNLADKCPNIGLEESDFVDWVFEAITLACEYRKWQTDEKVNAQQCINQCIETIRVRKYYEFNLDKHSANYNTVSLETPVSDETDTNSAKTLGDTLSDEEEELQTKNVDGHSAAREMIQTFINKKKLVEAIILDVIAFGETTKVLKHVAKGIDENGDEYKYTKYSQEFWAFKCIQLLSNLPDTYTEYFNDSYDVVPAQFNAALEVLKKANNQKLYREVRATLKSARTLVSRYI